MDYRDEFYDKYFSSHVLPRKGKTTLEGLMRTALFFQKLWGDFFPSDRQAQIIDVGCGNGSLLWWLQGIGFEKAEGIDVSAEQVNVAQELGVKNVQSADLIDFLSEKRNYYDVVVLRDVIEHFPKQEIVRVLRICYASLKKGGRIIIQVPNAETPFFGRIRYGDFTHEMAFTASSLRQLLGVIGFTDAEFHSTGPVIVDYNIKSVVAFLLRKMVGIFYRLLIFAETRQRHVILSESIIVMAFQA